MVPIIHELSSLKVELDGVFSLVLFGSGAGKIAFLYREGGRYVIEPYAPSFEYNTVTGLDGRQALERATLFIGQHRDVLRARLSAVQDLAGTIAGYEIRPLFNPSAFGAEDILDVGYRFSARKVEATIRLISSSEGAAAF